MVRDNLLPAGLSLGELSKEGQRLIVNATLHINNAIPVQYIVALDINNISEQGLAESEISQ